MKTQKNENMRRLSRKISIVFHGLFKRRAYLKSSHIEEYEEIAINNGVYPGYVYAIAHSLKALKREDLNILKELKVREIVF